MLVELEQRVLDTIKCVVCCFGTHGDNEYRMTIELMLIFHFNVVNLIKRLKFCMGEWLHKSLTCYVLFKVLQNLFLRKKPTTRLL